MKKDNLSQKEKDKEKEEDLPRLKKVKVIDDEIKTELKKALPVFISAILIVIVGIVAIIGLTMRSSDSNYFNNEEETQEMEQERLRKEAQERYEQKLKEQEQKNKQKK